MGPGWVVQTVGASSCTPKGCWFDSWSGCKQVWPGSGLSQFPVPAWIPVWVCTKATDPCFSPINVSLSPFCSVSKKANYQCYERDEYISVTENNRGNQFRRYCHENFFTMIFKQKPKGWKENRYQTRRRVFQLAEGRIRAKHQKEWNICKPYRFSPLLSYFLYLKWQFSYSFIFICSSIWF